MFYLVSVALYRFHVAQRPFRSVGYDGRKENTARRFIPRGVYDIETNIERLNASDFTLELVYNDENAFDITVTNFYTIEFTYAPEIRSILGFESSMHVKGLDN